MYTVIDVEAGKSAYVQYVITVVAADINNAVRLNLLKDKATISGCYRNAENLTIAL